MTDPRRLKIAIWSSYRFAPPVNGGHRVIYDLGEQLHRFADVEVFSSFGNQGAPFTVTALFKDRKWKYLDPSLMLRLREHLRRSRPDVLIANQHFHAHFLLPVCRLLGIPVVIYAHNLEYERFRTLGKWWWSGMRVFERWSMQRAAATWFVSHDERQRAIREFGLLEHRTLFVPHMVANRAPHPLPDSKRTAIRQQYGVPSSANLLVFYGAYTYAPNVEALRLIVDELLPRWRRAASKTYFLLICGGGLRDTALVEKLKAASDAHYAGFVEQLEPVIQAADVVLNPVTTGGGVKTKVIQALALGTPVLSSSSGAEGIVRTATGNALRIVPDRDYEAYSTVLSELLRERPAVPAAFYTVYGRTQVTDRILTFLRRMIK